MWCSFLICFFIHQAFGIVNSQIEIKRIFNVVSVITNLWWFRLGIEDLDNIILIVKNSPNDVRVECALNPKIMNDFMIFEATMII